MNKNREVTPFNPPYSKGDVEGKEPRWKRGDHRNAEEPDKS